MSGGLIRPRDIIVDDVLDRIYKAWVAHKIDDLDFADRQVLERMEAANAELKAGGKRSRYTNVVEFLYQSFNKVDDKITRRTIQNDIARARRFFLSTESREEKEYGRGMAIAHGERMLDIFEERRLEKEWIALFKEINELKGYKKDDVIEIDLTAIQPPPMMVTTDAASLGVPEIENIEEEIRLLKSPKAVKRNTDDFEEAEDVTGGSE